MGTTKYFAQVAEIHRRFSIIHAEFNYVIQLGIACLKQNGSTYFPDRGMIDRFDDYLRELKGMKNNLVSIKTEVGNRGLAFFKHGNIKQKLDQILTPEAIQKLKAEMKYYVKAAKKTEERNQFNNTPLDAYFKKYGQELSQEYNKPIHIPLERDKHTEYNSQLFL